MNKNGLVNKSGLAVKRKTHNDLREQSGEPAIKSAKFKNRSTEKVDFNKMIARVELEDIKKLPFYPGRFNDVRVLKMARDINAVRSSQGLQKFSQDKTITELQELRCLIDGAINRIGVLVPKNFSSNVDITTIPDSPVSIDNDPIDIGENNLSSMEQGLRVSDQDVIEGKGVIATRSYKEGDIVGLYEGEIACRVFCHDNKERFHAFTISEKGDDFEIKPLDKDTYVAWSGTTIQASRENLIELGRNGNTDLRYLNHSKNSNVDISSNGDRQLLWKNRDNLQLHVTAIKSIGIGEELVMDYDPETPDADIDFNASLVEPLTDEIKGRIYKQIQILKGGKGKKREEIEVKLPKALDDKISEVMTVLEDIRIETRKPALIDEFWEKLSPVNQNVLRCIYSCEEPNMIVKNISLCIDGLGKELMVSTCLQLKEYLGKTIFNSNNTFISVEELKVKLEETAQREHRKKSVR